MAALLAANGSGDWTSDGNTPLVRAMADLAVRVVQRIVVRSPVVAILQETRRETEEGPVHEVVARTGVLLRSPIALLRRHRRPVFVMRAANETEEPAANDRPKRA